MPIIVDHYAFDAYAFCIDAENLKVFHTGILRAWFQKRQAAAAN